jgi:hypothetical protein
MLSFGPSDLDWWLWLVNAGGLAVLAALIYATLLDLKAKGKSGAISVVFRLLLWAVLFTLLFAGFLCAIFGIVGLFFPK